jgi:release factor glutamine methyltransferase
VASAESILVAELVERGLEPREARWIVEEFAPGRDPDARAAVVAAAQRRLAGEPLQYVIGHWPFRTLDLDVDSRVLIPRPETEELVDVAIGELAGSSSSAPLIVDLGCGSGAIGLSLLVELSERGVPATLVAVDRSPGALAVARRNALKHRVLNVSFVESDWFSELDDSLTGRVDLIVANPPYVGADEFEHLDDVLRHEPRGALVAGDVDGVAGLADIAAIIEQAPKWLRPRGALVIEHGHGHGPASRSLAESAGFVDVRTVLDVSGHDRFLVARMEP